MRQSVICECPLILREFLGYMETVKGRSSNTCEEYFRDLRTFFRFLKQHRHLVDEKTEFDKIVITDIDIDFLGTVTLTDVYEFMYFLSADRSNSNATKARKCSSIRIFYNYLTSKTGKLKVNPVAELDTPKIKKSLPKYLTLEQCLEMLNLVEGDYKERDYCILTLFLNCGLRLAELTNINLSDIRSDSTIRVTGKGNKERILYLNDACKNAIDNYLKVRPHDAVIDKNALFISRNRKRISRRTVQDIVKKNLSKIGLGYHDGYSTHKLRHTAATLMYQHGNVDIRVLKDILGHENLGTTEIYTHLSDTQMENAVNSNPLASVKSKKFGDKKND